MLTEKLCFVFPLLKFTFSFASTVSLSKFAAMCFFAARFGRTDKNISVAEYIGRMDKSAEVDFDWDQEYAFDRFNFLTQTGLGSALQFHPLFQHMVRSLTFALGSSGTGIPFHIHEDGWLEVCVLSMMPSLLLPLCHRISDFSLWLWLLSCLLGRNTGCFTLPQLATRMEAIVKRSQQNSGNCILFVLGRLMWKEGRWRCMSREGPCLCLFRDLAN